MTQRFILSGTFELPFGPGKAVGANATGLARHLLEGWMMSPILTLQTGLPFTPSLVASVANTGTFSRPDRLADGQLEEPSANRWFDASAFATPRLYTFGNAGRNILTGPGTRQLDVSFQKTTYFSENRNRNLQFPRRILQPDKYSTAEQPGCRNRLSDRRTDSLSRRSSQLLAYITQIQFGLKFYF